MTSYVISPLAQGDLDGIWDYIAADRLLERFRETFARLARHPLLGRQRDELRLGLRSLSVRKYVDYYARCATRA
jgi:toxin ParE1/3/4